MSVTITINADSAYAAREEMRFLISTGGPAPAVSDVSSDTAQPKPDTTEPAASEVVPGKPRGRKPKNEGAKAEGPALNVVANISTGDEREPPADDIAEKLESAGMGGVEGVMPAEEAKVLTIDDVRNAATPYIKKHTMAMAQLDLQDCLEAAVGIRQISKLNTADQTMLKKAVEAFEAAGKADARFVKAA